MKRLVLLAALPALAACEEAPTVAAAAEAPAVAASAGATADVPPPPASLSADERIIWNSLTDDAKRQAAVFIANGGTLTQFVAL